MLTTTSDTWEAITYEVRMFRETYEVACDQPTLPGRVLQNAVVESAVLHSRILCDFLLDKKDKDDDVIISDVISHLGISKSNKLFKLICKLSRRYNTQTPNTPYSPYTAFNKLMAHLTTYRGISGEYKPYFEEIRPVIQEIITELECLTGVTFGRLGDPISRPQEGVLDLSIPNLDPTLGED
jgi:hypothetical protein